MSPLYTVLMLDRVPWWWSVVVALVVGLVSAVVVYVFVVPWQKRRIILSHNISNNGRVADIDAADNKETTALSVISQRSTPNTSLNETPKYDFLFLLLLVGMTFGKRCIMVENGGVRLMMDDFFRALMCEDEDR